MTKRIKTPPINIEYNGAKIVGLSVNGADLNSMFIFGVHIPLTKRCIGRSNCR